jgi:hypothetical protein
MKKREELRYWRCAGGVERKKGQRLAMDALLPANLRDRHE